MFENIIKFFKNIGKKESTKESSDTAKERLHLVLMQDRANVSADFLELMKQEIIEVIKKYIDVDEKAIDVRLTNKSNEDGTTGAPALYANIPITTIKNEARKVNANIALEKVEESVKKASESTEKVKKKEKVQDVSEEEEEIEQEEKKEKKKAEKKADKPETKKAISKATTTKKVERARTSRTKVAKEEGEREKEVARKK